jgi:hypothetical protein
VRAKNKSVSWLLPALLVSGFALTASAQVSHLVSSTPTDVIQTGLTEVLGEVRLTKNSAPTGEPQTTIPGAINVLYQDVPIVNTFDGSLALEVNGGGPGVGRISNTGGITIDVTGGYNDAGVSASISRTRAGGLIKLFVPGGLIIAEGDRITINGVRARVAGLPVEADVVASLESDPPGSDSFINTATLPVARTHQGLIVSISGVTTPICVIPPFPSVTVREGFPGAFVQYVTVGGVTPAFPRARFGSDANTQIHIDLRRLPSPDVDFDWPDAVPARTGLGTLFIVSESSSDAVYQFTTTNQGTSDLDIESFTISPTVTLAATSGFGQSRIQAQLYPSRESPSVPRFRDPLQPVPAGDFLNVSKCVTNLLFPFLTNRSSFDSGIIIANASSDPFSATTLAQSGTITLYGYSQFASGGTAPKPIAVTTPVIEAGDTYAMLLSEIPALAGFQGYVIAICRFPFAHGAAFLSGKYGSSVPEVAGGYLALVIPDPSVTGGVRRASPPAPLGSGESAAH